MSDPDARPDPIDNAYVQAEAALDDAAARTARRARVLAAVAAEPVAPPSAFAPSRRRPGWQSARWLAEAGVIGFVVLAATQLDHPAWRQPWIAPKAPPTPTVGAPASPAVAAPAPTPHAAGQPSAAASEAGGIVALPPPTPAPRVVAAGKAAPATEQEAAASPPSAPPVVAEEAPRAFPEAAPPPPPPAASDEAAVAGQTSTVVVAAQKRQNTQQKVPVAISAFTSQSRQVAPIDRRDVLGLSPADPAARLRAAAAAGRTQEVKALLSGGVSVDAADANGDTALMISVRADHPATAAALRREGASLDSENRAGESARDMALKKGDAKLNRALGLEP